MYMMRPGNKGDFSVCSTACYLGYGATCTLHAAPTLSHLSCIFGTVDWPAGAAALGRRTTFCGQGTLFCFHRALFFGARGDKLSGKTFTRSELVENSTSNILNKSRCQICFVPNNRACKYIV